MEHFCTCTDLGCACHPANHENGCDLCIRKNLAQDEIPACFYKKLGDTSELTEYTMEAFVRFFLQRRGLPQMPER